MFAKKKHNTIMKKEKKQHRKLTDEELEQVTGGKEQYPNSQGMCENQEYRLKYPDECGIVFSSTTEDLK